MRRLAVLVMCVVACGHRDAPPPSSGSAVAMPATGSAGGSATGGSAVPTTPPTPPSPALPPPRELLAAVPADTAFVFVTFEPIAAGVWSRVIADLDPAAIHTAAALRISSLAPTARVEYAAWSELASALASGAARRLGVAATARVVVYGFGLVPVARVELADPTAATASVERIFAAAGMASARRAGTSTWIVESGNDSLLVAIAANQLVLARGARDALVSDAARIVGAAPVPLDEAQLRKFATDHQLATHAAGWIDVPRVVALARTPGGAAALAELEPRCRDAVLDTLGQLGRIGLGITDVAANRLALAVTLDVDPKTAAALQAATRVAPSLPAGLPGHPLFALALTAPPDDLVATWLARQKHLAGTCGGGDASLPRPWSSIRSAALVIYSGTWKDLLPANLDGYVAVTAPALEPIVEALARVVPGIATTSLRDGGPFVPVAAPVQPVAASLALARHGTTLVGATGPDGRAHAAELAVRDPAPLFQLMIDLARITGSRRAAAPPTDDDDVFVAEDSFLDEAGVGVSALVADIAARVTAGPSAVRLELAATLAPPHGRAPRVSNPRIVLRDQCRALLWRSLGATVPALAKLGITDDLEALQTTYTTSIEASQAVSSCAKLKPAERACLFAARDPLTAAATCAPDPEGFHDSRLELPPLLSFFGPDPLRARLHPPVDGAALRAKLAGTWERTGTFETEVWKIDAAGNVTVTETEKGSAAKPAKHYTLELHAAGELELHAGDGTETRGFIMTAPDRFYLPGSELAPVASEDHVLVPLSRGFLVREPKGCWVITREGLLLAATCRSEPAHTLQVEYTAPCSTPANDGCKQTASYRFLPGWIVEARAIDDGAFIRRR